VRRTRELGKSLKSIAAEAGLARSHLYKLTDGTIRCPSVQTLLRLAKAMEVSPIALLRLYGNINAPNINSTGDRSPTSWGIGVDDPRDVAILNSDMTIPHHSVVSGGELFEKVWEIQNMGTVCWTGRRLTRIDSPCLDVDGQSSSHPAIRPHLASLEHEVVIPKTLPGCIAHMRVEFIAPRENCSVASIWRIEDQLLRPCYESTFLLKVVVTVIDH
jgi:hypothetical protein